jgi:thiol-disulfide isomerase/thioredoxin
MSKRSLARWVGRALVMGLAALFAFNVAWAVRNFKALREVSTPLGTDAPNFTVKLLSGGEMHLQDAAGHPLVLAFWATWCAPCRVELPALERLYHRFGPSGTGFLAVNVEEADMRREVEAFVRATGLSLPVALEGGTLSARYHVETIPHLVILDGSGKVREVLQGVHDENEVAKAIERAQAAEKH